MISVNVNVPFGIGDLVQYESEDYELDSVTCPFCRGQGFIDFGMNEYNLGKNGLGLVPMVRKCSNCENGRIMYVKNIRMKTEKVTVLGISSFTPGGLSEISVMENGGRIITVPQHSLSALKQGELNV